jgi:hypothetical protein
MTNLGRFTFPKAADAEVLGRTRQSDDHRFTLADVSECGATDEDSGARCLLDPGHDGEHFGITDDPSRPVVWPVRMSRSAP